LGSDEFEHAAERWIDAKTEPRQWDVRQERRAFIEVLSAVGERAVSSSSFYDIAHAVEWWRLNPIEMQDGKVRKAIKDIKTQTEHLMHAAQTLRGALEYIDPVPEGLVQAKELPRYVTMLRLQSTLRESTLGRALEPSPDGSSISEVIIRALADLDQRLCQCLQEWDNPKGTPPNVAVHALLWRLSEIYRAMGGHLDASWDNTRGHPRGPFSKYLTVIYLSFPSDFQRIASKNPSAFIAKADEVLSDSRKHARQGFLAPVTDVDYLKHLPADTQKVLSLDRDE
jgi:hypothetical protein